MERPVIRGDGAGLMVREADALAWSHDRFQAGVGGGVYRFALDAERSMMRLVGHVYHESRSLGDATDRR